MRYVHDDGWMDRLLLAAYTKAGIKESEAVW